MSPARLGSDIPPFWMGPGSKFEIRMVATFCVWAVTWMKLLSLYTSWIIFHVVYSLQSEYWSEQQTNTTHIYPRCKPLHFVVKRWNSIVVKAQGWSCYLIVYEFKCYLSYLDERIRLPLAHSFSLDYNLLFYYWWLYHSSMLFLGTNKQVSRDPDRTGGA